MSGVCKKIACVQGYSTESKLEKEIGAKFRKGIDARMSTPLKENHPSYLERTPNKDNFSK